MDFHWAAFVEDNQNNTGIPTRRGQGLMNKFMCRFEATVKKKQNKTKQKTEPIFRHGLPSGVN